MLILFKSSLGTLLLDYRLDPTFSSTMSRLFHKFIQAFDTLKIPVHCFGTRDTLKKVIYLSIVCPCLLHSSFTYYETQLLFSMCDEKLSCFVV